jgi:hypothetical protein
MPQQIFNSIETGLSLRTKLNANFAELYALIPSGGSTFDPKTIPALTLWLDAADSSTLFDATVGGSNVTTQDAPVTRWKDKSGNNFDMIQSVENSKPILKTAFINGKNCIRTDGVNDFMSSGANFNGYPSFTCFMVGKSTTTGAAISIGCNINNGKGAFLNVNASQSFIGSSYGTSFGTVVTYSSTGLPSFTSSLAGGVYKNLKFTSIFNGQKGDTTPNMAFYNYFIQELPIDIGCAGRLNGSPFYFSAADYCEILIYGTELTSIQRQQIELYLNQKWAIF